MIEDHIAGSRYIVYATRLDGRRVVVSESVTRVDLRRYKNLLVMRSIEFDETTRLYQFRNEQNSAIRGCGLSSNGS